MGEWADSLLEGDACEGCGEFFEDGGDGYPRRCEACQIGQNQLAEIKRRNKIKGERHKKAAGK